MYKGSCSLTTRRGHLENRHLQEYLEVVGKHGWFNTLPKQQISELPKQWAEQLDCMPFSSLELLKQLVKVIVANDLVCDAVGS